jgi:hypothetical protein
MAKEWKKESPEVKQKFYNMYHQKKTEGKRKVEKIRVLKEYNTIKEPLYLSSGIQVFDTSS